LQPTYRNHFPVGEKSFTRQRVLLIRSHNGASSACSENFHPAPLRMPAAVNPLPNLGGNAKEIIKNLVDL